MTDHAEECRSLLAILFAPTDHVLIRPIETWVDQDAKRSAIVHGQVRTVRAEQIMTPHFFGMVCLQAEREKANLFFGVCPRFGASGFDLAWQIRTVRALWADVDHCTPEAALLRCDAAGLPCPSAIVSSGHGAHLYWALSEPYAIDDAPAPAAVQSEWTEISGKRRQIHFFTDETGERVNLDDPTTGRPLPRNRPPLSPRALHAQDVIAGIAAKIGGDSTQDLSRLLRLPGTMNRKDERNGRDPVPCRLVEIDAGLRYPIETFAPFASLSPDAARRKRLAAVQLPDVRPLRAKGGQDRLRELITICGVAEPGARSEADFSLCCWAVENGVGRDELWGRIAGLGKFGEAGESYFDRTWQKAEDHARGEILLRIERPKASNGAGAATDHQAAVAAATASLPPFLQPQPAPQLPQLGNAAPAPSSGPSPATTDTAASQRKPVIAHNPEVMPVGSLLARVTDTLLAAGGIYSRAGMPALVKNDEIAPLDSTSGLASLLNSHAEFVLFEQRGDNVSTRFEPLPDKYAKVWLCHPTEIPRLPEISMFTKNPVYTGSYRLSRPGYDADTGIYYAGPEIAPVEGTEALNSLLADFCFRSPADRTNFLAMLLTIVLMPKFVGSKPAALFVGNQPGLGKTILAQILAILRDGKPVSTCSYVEKDEEFEKRLGSLVRSGVSTVIVDNAKKAGRRAATIDSAVLERSITDPILSFRLLGQSTDIRVENSHIFCVTANGPDVSLDLMSRCIPINLWYEGAPAGRAFSLQNPEGYTEENRERLLGELLGMVETWKAAGMPLASSQTRFNKRGWGDIVGGILHACGEPDFLGNQSTAAAEMDSARRDFAELVEAALKDLMGQQPKRPAEWAAKAAEEKLLTEELGDGSKRSRATKMALLLSRYVGEVFEIEEIGPVLITTKEDRNGKQYVIERPREGF